jgi:hypothetical protein
MTEIQNSTRLSSSQAKQLAFDLNLRFRYCNLEFICNLVLVFCYFLFIRV